MKGKKIIFKAFANLLEKDSRISGVFFTGSAKKGKKTKYSDLDLWAVFSSETGLNSFRKDISSLASVVSTIRGIYECTAHHYFIIYKPSIQVDLNLISSAQFFSIKNVRKQFVFDRKFFLENKPYIKEKKGEKTRETDFLLQGFTTLERCLSKLIKKDYFVAVRFLESVREDCLLPLFKMAGIQKMVTPISLDVNRLRGGLRELFINTYASPTRNSCVSGVRAMSSLLLKIAEKLKISGFEDYKVKFNNFK